MKYRSAKPVKERISRDKSEVERKRGRREKQVAG